MGTTGEGSSAFRTSKVRLFAHQVQPAAVSGWLHSANIQEPDSSLRKVSFATR